MKPSVPNPQEFFMKIHTLRFVVLSAAMLISPLQVAHAETLKIITIAAMVPRSGSLQGFGDSLFNGIQLAYNEAKVEFQKMGFELKLKSFDDMGTPETGVKLAKSLANDPTILVMVGPVSSDVAIPVSAVLAPFKIAIVTPTSNPQVTDRKLPNVNRTTGRDDAQGPTGAKMIVETLQARSVFIIDDTSVFGKGVADQAAKTFKKTAIKIAGNISTAEKKDFLNVVNKVKVAKPDAIYFGGNYDVAIPLIQQLRKAGVTSTIMGADGLDVPELIPALKQDGVGLLYTTLVAPPMSYPNAKGFVINYNKQYKIEPTGNSVLGYDAMKGALQSLRDAIAKVGAKKPITRAEVMDSVRNINIQSMDLASGAMSFNKIGDRKEVTVFVLRVGEDGIARVNTAIKVKQP
jgi:branched-chain amino acid transport system substrate-binding protein